MEKSKHNIKLDAKIRINKDVISRKVQDEEVILDLKSGTYYGLDPMGSLVWDKIKAGKSIKLIASSLTKEYNAPEAKIQKDILELVQDLKKNNLVQIK